MASHLASALPLIQLESRPLITQTTRGAFRPFTCTESQARQFTGRSSDSKSRVLEVVSTLQIVP
jgi:hypothetical protein